jgi:hypothetical protein
LLHVEWIAADINGDNRPELVPATDRPGPIPPKRVYTLFSSSSPRSLVQTLPTIEISKDPLGNSGFYLGGNIYSNWASVPENYKTTNSSPPDPRRSTATLFTFTW